MSINKKDLKFECTACGCNELAYQVYAKCITKVELKENDNIEYSHSRFDPDDYLCAQNTFLCAYCKTYVEHRGSRMETEKELLEYLKMDLKAREKEQREYEKYVDCQAQTQEQREKEQEFYDAQVAETDMYADID